jgi:SagB-type dehydrogenase family enzyme
MWAAQQELWRQDAQGITDASDFRTAPSAGALYPLKVYTVVGNIQELNPGVYRYEPEGHQLVKTMESDRRDGLAARLKGATVKSNFNQAI